MADIYINDYGNEINLDKLRYDLAMIYAKRKFNEIDLSLPGMAPDSIEYLDDLLKYFGEAYQQLCAMDQDTLIHMIDINHECSFDDWFRTQLC